MAARLAVFCSGYGSNFQAILDAIRRKKLEASVVLVVCDNPKAFALKRARQNKIPVFLFDPKAFESREGHERLIVRVLKSQKADLVVLAGFMLILSPYFVRAYRGRILNIHPSLLPRFKGAYAIRDAFQAKVKETGATVHLVTEDLDAGPILFQKKVRVTKNDTLASLEKKIHRAEHEIYPLAINRYLNELNLDRYRPRLLG